MEKVEEIRWPFRADHFGAEKLSKKVTVTENEIDQEQERDWQSEDSPDPKYQSWHKGSIAPQLKDWEQQKEIGHSRSDKIKIVVINFLYVFFPLVYLFVGLFVAVLDGRPIFNGSPGFLEEVTGIQDPVSYAIRQVITVSVTVFPIVFTLLLCNTLKSAALYKAERGTTIVTLEQIMASKSFGSSLTGPYKFKRINKTAAFLFCLWLTSPLTTQALQRIFSISPEAHGTRHPSLWYLDTMSRSWNETLAKKAPVMSQAELGTLFESQTIQPESTMPNDAYGNPRIPMLSSVLKYPKDKNGFHQIGVVWDIGTTIRNNAASLDYSAALGIPISGLLENTTSYTSVADFTIETCYWTFDCNDWEILSFHAAAEIYDNSYLSYTNFYTRDHMHTKTFLWSSKDWSYFVAMNRTAHSHQKVTFGSKQSSHNQPNFATTTCHMKMHKVQAHLNCAGKYCRTMGLKSYDGFMGREPDIHFFDKMDYAFTQYNLDAKKMAIYPYGTGSSFLEKWLMQPDKAGQTNKNTGFANLGKTDISVFGERLAYLWTTFQHLSLAPQAFTARLPRNFDKAGDVHKGEDADGFRLYWETQATVHETVMAYKCSWGWLSVLFVSCAVVFLVIGANMYMQWHTLAPDVLGYVSSMTVNNQFTPLPRGGNTLDGMTRTLQLADLKVRLQDVDPEGHAGHIALATVDGQPLQPGRKYW